MSDIPEKSHTYGFGMRTHLSVKRYKQVSVCEFTVNFGEELKMAYKC